MPDAEGRTPRCRAPRRSSRAGRLARRRRTSTHHPPTTTGIQTRDQAKNASFVLPADLVAFLEFTNGLRVQWSAQCLQTEVVVGTFSINSLRNITRLPVDSLGSPPREQRHHVADARTLPVPCAAYLIDQHPKVRRAWAWARAGRTCKLARGWHGNGWVRSFAAACRHYPHPALPSTHHAPS